MEDTIQEDKLGDIPGWLKQQWQEMVALTRHILVGGVRLLFTQL